MLMGEKMIIEFSIFSHAPHIKQLSLGFPVFYEGSEGDTIRLLKQNTVETVALLSKLHEAKHRINGR